MGARLVIVSNRLPLTLRKSDQGWVTERSSGGLASAMAPLLRSRHGIWIGWSGESDEDGGEERRAVLESWARNDQCFAIELPADVAKKFYEGYSNETLWPVFREFSAEQH